LNLVDKEIIRLQKLLKQNPKQNEFLIARIRFLKSGKNAELPKSTLELTYREVVNILK